MPKPKKIKPSGEVVHDVSTNRLMANAKWVRIALQNSGYDTKATIVMVDGKKYELVEWWHSNCVKKG